ncbi:uncharacterized protein LOC129317562 [Prosopis cineraria]|uniref:uncharacterized protein LOC129317562 n=1 Tax=Prosopis cineraria TaxID=364024 RepID=UPI0024106882|nr:uncharacterized protein LOC129317562 [Prosopis cineraria]
MSDEDAAAPAPPSPDSIRKVQSAIQSLSSIEPSIPTSLSSSNNPALSLLQDPKVSSRISALLREPNSGSGDNNLCRWLYDTFQSTVPELQLVVLRFLPVVAGIYLSRIVHRKPQAGFEAVLLALYASETNSRSGQAVTVTIPDLSHSSVYHESKSTVKNNATNLDLAVVSPSLEPHGTVRSTRRARIVGVALELYYSKISLMPIKSKIELCEFCKIWAGQDGDMYKGFGSESERKQIDDDDEDEDEVVGDGEEEPEIIVTEEEKRMKKKEGRIPLPWELLQPVLRILGHCLMGPNNSKEKELFDAASDACRCLYARAMHDVNPKAILAIGSLLRLLKRVEDNKFDDFDDYSDVISL